VELSKQVKLLELFSKEINNSKGLRKAVLKELIHKYNRIYRNKKSFTVFQV
jgi:hypothetical protein